MDLKNRILAAFDKSEFNTEDQELFVEFRTALNKGEVRAAEKVNDKWIVNQWVKKGILLGFRLGSLVKMPVSEHKSFIDKSTYPEREFSLEDRVRLVPGGSSVRSGAYIAPSVVLMPPMYVNVGAYVDEGSMVDSHALVGSCAQIGKKVHLSAAAQIGGVIEPIGANPVIIEDGAFIGGNCGVYEGVIIGKRAILAPGVIITGGTVVYDAVNNITLKSGDEPLKIPDNAVVIPGTRPLKSNPEYSIYCPIIIKYRDEKTETSVILEEAIR